MIEEKRATKLLKKSVVALGVTVLIVLAIGFAGGRTTSEWGKVWVLGIGLLALFVAIFFVDIKLGGKRRDVTDPLAKKLVMATVSKVLSFLLPAGGGFLIFGLLMEYGLIPRWLFGALMAYVICFAIIWSSIKRPEGIKRSQLIGPVALNALGMYGAVLLVGSLMFGLMYLFKKRAFK